MTQATNNPESDGAPPNLEEIFARALDLAAGERDAFLASACGDNEALRAEVEALLAAHHDAERGALLETRELDAIGGDAAREVAERVAAEQRAVGPDEQPGEWIGRYRLLERIGEGGFGTVWMAEQEKPLRRRVALKIVKLGMDTKQVVARFEQERQALALMDHPNIARVFDAGATPNGRPYFVMELVRGTRITEYCDEARLSTTERMKLFITVCQAVQHAHQKGIIHRDLKPSNVLVTLHDGVPVPKVIDFGVAKATNQDQLTDLTLFTNFREMIGTPLYMAPEQAEMSGLDIDTRSDIYSLGVLLYELLTGQPPFDATRLGEAGLNEMRRIIREEDPQTPSTLLRSLSAQDRTRVAANRRDDGDQLLHRLRGDLDWIVIKSLEKDRKRRYGTATELAQDVGNFIADQPVAARPPSALYKLRKFARRNKIVLAAATAVTLALVIGLGLTTWMFFKERRAAERALSAEQDAKDEADKSEEIATFLQDMMKGVGPSVALGRDTTILMEILERTAHRIDTELAGRPEVEAELRNTLGDIYRELGEYEEARAMHEKALELRRERWGNRHPKVAIVLNNLALDLEKLGEFEKAAALQQEALALDREFLGPQHPSIAANLSSLGTYLWRQGKLEEAEATIRDAVARLRDVSDRISLATALLSLGNVLHTQGNLDDAEKQQREALALFEAVHGPEHPSVATALNNLAQNLIAQRNFADAETVARKALDLDRKLLGEGHADIAITLNSLSEIMMRQGKLEEAEDLQRESLAIKRETLGDRHPGVARALNNLATILENRNKLDEAETLHREAQPMMRELLGETHPNLANSLGNLARILRKQQRFDEALPLQREAVAVLERLHGDQHAKVGKAWRLLGEILQHLGELTEAESLHRKAYDLERAILGDGDSETQTTFKGLALLLMLQNKFPEVENLYRQGLRAAQNASPENPGPWLYYLQGLAFALMKQERYTEADREFDEVISSTLENSSEVVPLLRMRGSHRARRQQWEKAATDYARAITIKPDQDLLYLEHACVLSQLAQLEPYVAHCQKLLDRFGDTNDPATANRMSMACLLRPSPGIDLEKVHRMAEVQLAGSELRPATYAYQFVMGFCEFRRGEVEAAIQWMEKVLSHSEVPPEKATQANAVLAMAQFQLNESEDRPHPWQPAWERARDGLAGNNEQDLGKTWVAWAITNCILEEARSSFANQPGAMPPRSRNQLQPHP